MDVQDAESWNIITIFNTQTIFNIPYSFLKSQNIVSSVIDFGVHLEYYLLSTVQKREKEEEGEENSKKIICTL